MGERQTSIQGIRDRLTGLLADWGAELATVLRELEEQRARVQELEGRDDGMSEELAGLKNRIEGQESLIETLKADAEEASKLRQEVRGKDLDLERLSSELDSKKELIRALRRDAEATDRLKADAKLKDREIEELKARLARAEQHAVTLTAEVEAAREAAAGDEEHESAELEAMRAELDARKTMIKSLRADQERVAILESSLEEKREIIGQLEASINRHSGTIAELKRSAEAWKRKYQALRVASSTATTSVSMPALSDTDVRAIEQLEQSAEIVKPDATIAIDMRRSLLEARRTAAQSGEK
jgi:DNA repair exonuclease SbcCD ATPase subunit